MLVLLRSGLIANAATLTEKVKTASFLSHLPENVNNALSIQEGLDRQIEQKYDTVHTLGDESQEMKVRSPLECYAQYLWICITANI